MYKLPERWGRREGVEVIWAMPERKHSFFRRCSLSQVLLVTDERTDNLIEDKLINSKCPNYLSCLVEVQYKERDNNEKMKRYGSAATTPYRE